jgi:hypothetical protein
MLLITSIYSIAYCDIFHLESNGRSTAPKPKPSEELSNLGTAYRLVHGKGNTLLRLPIRLMIPI